VGRVETPARGAEAGPNLFREVKPLKAATRSIKRIAGRIFKTAGEIFAPARNSTYKTEDLTKALIETCVRNSSAEQCSMPSPDTMLRRLQVDEETFDLIIKDLNAGLLRKLHPRRRVVTALDCRTLPFYGIEQPVLVSSSRLPGTTLGIESATISIVEAGRTFTLEVKQVGPFTSKTKVLPEMLEAVKGLVKPKILLLDRAFFSVEVINALKSEKQHFLMPAKRTAPIKRLCKAFERGEIPPVVDYTVASFEDSAHVKLIFVRRKTKKGLKTHVFVSDAALEPEVASELYRCRWRIETNNSEIEKFRARTTSRSMELRRIYYSLAALLYNLWIVMRSVLGGLRSYEFKRILSIRLNVAVPSVTFECGPSPPP